MLAVIVTGVSRGLGEALAAELLARDCRVLGVGRTSSARLASDRYRFVSCDLSQAAELFALLEPAFDAIAAERPDAVCLVNNAATIEPAGVLGQLDAADIASSLAVNLVAPVTLSSLFCRVFAGDATERRIINVSSGAAQSTLPGESLYCIAKAGLEMLTRSLAAEHSSPRFRAITLRPGIIDTQMQAFARSQPKTRMPSVDLFKGFHAGKQLVAPDVVARKVVERLVLGPVEHGRTYSYAEL
jgi:benzil reductase ((S)-benzoin forming)